MTWMKTREGYVRSDGRAKVVCHGPTGKWAAFIERCEGFDRPFWERNDAEWKLLSRGFGTEEKAQERADKAVEKSDG